MPTTNESRQIISTEGINTRYILVNGGRSRQYLANQRVAEGDFVDVRDIDNSVVRLKVAESSQQIIDRTVSRDE